MASAEREPRREEPHPTNILFPKSFRVDWGYYAENQNFFDCPASDVLRDVFDGAPAGRGIGPKEMGGR
jgi:hypothetical protein